MTRFATLADSFGVGSLHVGLRDLNPEDNRALFQFVANSPFLADIFATLDYDYNTNTGSNWYKVTNRLFLGQGDLSSKFILVGGSYQKVKPDAGVSLDKPGVYALDSHFMPAAFRIDVTSVTSGDPLKVLFGV